MKSGLTDNTNSATQSKRCSGVTYVITTALCLEPAVVMNKLGSKLFQEIRELPVISFYSELQSGRKWFTRQNVIMPLFGKNDFPLSNITTK